MEYILVLGSINIGFVSFTERYPQPGEIIKVSKSIPIKNIRLGRSISGERNLYIW